MQTKALRNIGSLRKLMVLKNTNSHFGKCSTVLSIISPFHYPLNEAACPPGSTVYSPIIPYEGIYTLMRVH